MNQFDIVPISALRLRLGVQADLAQAPAPYVRKLSGAKRLGIMLFGSIALWTPIIATIHHFA